MAFWRQHFTYSQIRFESKNSKKNEQKQKQKLENEIEREKVEMKK